MDKKGNVCGIEEKLDNLKMINEPFFVYPSIKKILIIIIWVTHLKRFLKAEKENMVNNSISRTLMGNSREGQYQLV